jgi:DeoR/GlpR family transcriptional regulator of sugar metabolism
VEQKGRAGMEELCAFLETSEATVRRDLASLAAEGLIKRVHGGAVVGERLLEEPPVLQRCGVFTEQKRAIGRAAAALIHDGETIFLGSGSTVLEVARNLTSRRELRVITNSLPIVNLLADVPEIHLVVTGGFLRNAERTFVGFLVEKCLAELRADKTIVGIQAIHPEHGLTNDWLPETMVDRAIVRFAPELVVVADSSKFGTTRLSFVTGLSEVGTIVTDAGIEASMAKALTDRGVRLIVAESANGE